MCNEENITVFIALSGQLFKSMLSESEDVSCCSVTLNSTNGAFSPTLHLLGWQQGQLRAGTGTSCWGSRAEQGSPHTTGGLHLQLLFPVVLVIPFRQVVSPCFGFGGLYPGLSLDLPIFLLQVLITSGTAC